MLGHSPRGRIALRAPFLGLFAASLVAAGLVPHIHRLRHPSMFGDDLPRVFVLQTQSLQKALTTPFNEHVAPVFDAVTWIAWRASGRRLTALPLAFTVAAFVPFLLASAMLALYARRALGSWPPALLAVAVFAVAPIHVVETVWWYSGSNHMWAVFWTLVALLGASRGDKLGLLAVAAGTALAPACSMMGVLAFPACAAEALMSRRRRDPAGVSPAVSCLAGVAGLGLYLLVAISFGLLRAVLTGRIHAAQPLVGLEVAGEAPMLVLVPALFGFRDLDQWIAPAWALAASGLFAVVVLAWSLRSRYRATILVGLGLIAGGYLIIYPFRTAGGQELMLRTARYHVYPQLGLALLAGAAARRFLGGARGGQFASLLCVALMAVHLPQMTAESGLYDFPNQARTLAALERVREICETEGIGSRQAVAALEPIRPRWMPINHEDANAAWMIGKFDPSRRVPDAEVRGRLLSALSAEDREGLFGGMDAGPYLTPIEAIQSKEPALIATCPTGSSRIRAVGPADEFATDGWPSSLEYTLSVPSRSVASARWLILPVLAPHGGVEVWWDDGQGLWTEGRSVRWPVESLSPRGGVWGVPLERLPHWNGRDVRRLRVVFTYPGEIAVRPPSLARPRTVLPPGPSIAHRPADPKLASNGG
jgi:hypothetical protein